MAKSNEQLISVGLQCFLDEVQLVLDGECLPFFYHLEQHGLEGWEVPQVLYDHVEKAVVLVVLVGEQDDLVLDIHCE